MGPMLPPYCLRTRVLSPVPLVEDVGRQVVDELVVELRQQPDALVVEAAVARTGGVLGEGAAAHRRRPEVVDAAAVIGGGVAGEGAVAHRQRAAGRLTSLDDAEVENAAAIESGVAGEGAVAHHRRPEILVVEAAAAEAGGAASEGAAAHGERTSEV